MRRAERMLRPGTIARLRDALPPGRGSCTRPFAEEVVRQVAHPLGAEPSSDPEGEEARTAARVLALLGAAFEGASDARAAAIRRLGKDGTMLAAFFQNLDLLEDCARGHAGAVAALVAEALEGPS